MRCCRSSQKALVCRFMMYNDTPCMLLAQVDASFQRNPVAFDIYRHLGGWATETEYVNVDWHGRLATACPLGNMPGLPGLPFTSPPKVPRTKPYRSRLWLVLCRATNQVRPGPTSVFPALVQICLGLVV